MKTAFQLKQFFPLVSQVLCFRLKETGTNVGDTTFKTYISLKIQKVKA